MLKLIVLGVVAFFITGIAIETLLTKFPFEQFQQAPPPSPARFVQAQQDGATIDPLPPGDNVAAPGHGPIEVADCSAINLSNQSHPYFLGTVTDVIDGDTINVRVEGAHMRVRLWGIDAPEHNQQGGAAAYHHLRALIPVDSKIEVHPMDMDIYGRVVANLGNGQDWAVNVKMIASGWAYHVNAYESKGNRCLFEAEKLARSYKAGVWEHGEFGGIRPWEHRQTEIQERGSTGQGEN